MMRRRRRAVLIAILTLATVGWVWNAARPSDEASGRAASHVSDPQGDAVSRSRPTLPSDPPSPTASPTASPTTSVARVPPTRAPRSHPTGRLAVVPGTGRVYGTGPLTRYIVEIEGGLATTGPAFATMVERTLGDPRSWGHGGARSFQRVDSGSVAFRVALAAPRTVDRYCAPLNTNSYTSCYSRGRAMLNLDRWDRGVPWYADDLVTYRQYMINHEVGHALGKGHVSCPRRGALAPIMQQQTLGMQGCRRNAWPYP